MSESRDYSLPNGFSDIGEHLRREEELTKQSWGQERQRWIALCRGGWKTSAELFMLLSQRIDHDLLFTEEKELVLPKIEELVIEECERVIPDLPAPVTAEEKNKLVKIKTENLWREISRRRPRYPGDKRTFG